MVLWERYVVMRRRLCRANESRNSGLTSLLVPKFFRRRRIQVVKGHKIHKQAHQRITSRITIAVYGEKRGIDSPIFTSRTFGHYE